MEIKGFELASQEKLDRIVLGRQDRSGRLVNGLGLYAEDGSIVDKEGNPVADEVILAAYDKEGGLILKDSIKVKNGAFWDFRFGKARVEPDVLFVFPVGGGDFVEVRDPKELGKAIQVIEQVKQKKAENVRAKKSRSRFKESK